MRFQLNALPSEPFAPLFELNSTDLRAAGAQLQQVTSKPGTPCRVSLADAEIGETVLLVNYEHQSADTPFRSRYAIFVRKGVPQRSLEPEEIPDVIKSRLISVRGFDTQHTLIDAIVCDGIVVDDEIATMFKNTSIEYIHLHYAAPGCFAASVNRISDRHAG